MQTGKKIDEMSDAELWDELAKREAARADAAIVEAGARYAAEHPVVGRWRVTTEGDCEGRTTWEFGVHVGHVADIAAALAPLAHYALDFKIEPEPTVPSTPCRPAEVNLAYIRFVNTVNGQPNNRPIHCILREEGMLDQLPRLLGDFARWVAREYPPVPTPAAAPSALPWTKGLPTVEQVAAHEAAHPSLAVGGYGFRGACWLAMHDPDGDVFGPYPGLVTLRVAHPGEPRHAVWIDQGRGEVKEPTVVLANGFSFWGLLATCTWAPGALWLPCTAEGVPVRLAGAYVRAPAQPDPA
jgi:hypothetical protein